MSISIRKMTSNDWPSVAAIYAEGISTGNATFQTEVPGWEDWDQAHIKNSRLVAVVQDAVAGWAALTPVSGRCVYAGVAEVSVYVAEAYRGQGIGLALLEQLVMESEANGFWTLQAGIFPENIGSIRIHEKCGFKVLGRHVRIGQMGALWRDTMLLERRSELIGI